MKRTSERLPANPPLNKKPRVVDVFNNFFGHRTVNMSFGDNSPAVVMGNFIVKEKKRKFQPLPPITIEDITEPTARLEKAVLMPIISDIDD